MGMTILTNIKTGTDLYDEIDILTDNKREALLLGLFTSNPLSPHHKEITIVVQGKSTTTNKDVKIEYRALSDYLSFGTVEDWFLIPMTPGTAQKIADHHGYILPTKKMVDQIWKASTIKLSPRPIAPKKGEPTRESSLTYRKHQRIIEDQLMKEEQPHGPGVLVAGHKKDVVITNQLKSMPNKVAIYGWHYPDGKPIQPLYLGHSAGYTDYSHGVRLVSKKAKVNDLEMDMELVLKDKELGSLLSHEGPMVLTKYP